MKTHPRILFVDDEEKFAEAMTSVLRSNGYKTDMATKGQQALELVRDSNYDLLVTDINMPGMDGIELIRHIREKKPEQRIMIITGFPTHESQDEAYELGTLNYIVKPFTTERFLELVKKALDENQTQEGLKGPVNLTCEYLIQMHAMEGKSIILEVRNGKNSGKIFFDKGRIIHAVTDSHEGEEAIYEIQSWRTGSFNVDQLKKKPKLSIEKSVDALLLEGARRMDEEAREKARKKENQKNHKEVLMPSKAQEILDQAAKNIDGLIASGVAGMDGILVAVVNPGKADADAFGAKFTLVQSLVSKTLKEVAEDQLDETLIEGNKAWYLNRFIGKGQYYLGIAVTKDAVLGNVRMVAKQTAEKLAEVL